MIGLLALNEEQRMIVSEACGVAGKEFATDACQGDWAKP